MSAELTFQMLRSLNVDRCNTSFPGRHLETWSLSDWMTALAGEVGEAANIIKKIRRGYDLTTGMTEEALKAKLADELADIQCYLDLLAASAGISLEVATKKKFNEVSKRVNYNVKL